MTGSSRPLRVALTLGVQESGGTRRQALEIGASLLRGSDVELVPIGNRSNLAALVELAGVQPRRQVVVPTDRSALEVLWTRYALDRRLARENVDVLHCLKQMVPRRSRQPVVLTIHDFMALDRRDEFTPVKARLLPPLYRRSIMGADRWITVSDAVAADLERRFSVPASSIVTVNPGSSSLAKSTPERLPGISTPYALAVGDLSPRKNLKFLARIWAEVFEATGMQLIAAGPEGWRSADTRATLAALNRAGLGRWVGPVTDGELRWLYEHATVVCVPSLAEGYGLAVVEAASFGRPVVASDIPSLEEAAGGSVTIAPVSAPDQWVDALIAAASSTDDPTPVASWSWEQATQATLSVYESAVSARPRAASAI